MDIIEMPYKLRKAPKKRLYWVVAEDGTHKSRYPIPKERAEAQMKALYIHMRQKFANMKGGTKEGIRRAMDMYDRLVINEEKLTGGSFRGGYNDKFSSGTILHELLDTDSKAWNEIIPGIMTISSWLAWACITLGPIFPFAEALGLFLKYCNQWVQQFLDVAKAVDTVVDKLIELTKLGVLVDSTRDMKEKRDAEDKMIVIVAALPAQVCSVINGILKLFHISGAEFIAEALKPKGQSRVLIDNYTGSKPSDIDDNPILPPPPNQPDPNAPNPTPPDGTPPPTGNPATPPPSGAPPPSPSTPPNTTPPSGSPSNTTPPTGNPATPPPSGAPPSSPSAPPDTTPPTGSPSTTTPPTGNPATPPPSGAPSSSPSAPPDTTPPTGGATDPPATSPLPSTRPHPLDPRLVKPEAPPPPPPPKSKVPKAPEKWEVWDVVDMYKKASDFVKKIGVELPPFDKLISSMASKESDYSHPEDAITADVVWEQMWKDEWKDRPKGGAPNTSTVILKTVGSQKSEIFIAVYNWPEGTLHNGYFGGEGPMAEEALGPFDNVVECVAPYAGVNIPPFVRREPTHEEKVSGTFIGSIAPQYLVTLKSKLGVGMNNTYKQKWLEANKATVDKINFIQGEKYLLPSVIKSTQRDIDLYAKISGSITVKGNILPPFDYSLPPPPPTLITRPAPTIPNTTPTKFYLT